MKLAAILVALLVCSCVTAEQWGQGFASTKLVAGRSQGTGSGSFRSGKDFDEDTESFYVGFEIEPWRAWQIQRVRLESSLPPPPPPTTHDVLDSADAPHPVDSCGAPVHDYLWSGEHERRCWYCEAIDPNPPERGLEPAKEHVMAGGTQPIGGTIAVRWNWAGQDVDASTIREPEWSVDEWISHARLKVVEKFKAEPVVYTRSPLAAISMSFYSGGAPFAFETNAAEASDSISLERRFLRLFDAELAEHRPDPG